MRRRDVRYGAIATLLLPILFAVDTVGADPWAASDARYFMIDRVCRDGAELSAVYLNPPPDVIANGATIDLGARLYTTTATPLTTSPTNRAPEAAYGPRLAATASLTMTYHATPLDADIDNDGAIEANERFSVYVGGGRLRWSRLLDVGAG